MENVLVLQNRNVNKMKVKFSKKQKQWQKLNTKYNNV